MNSELLNIGEQAPDFSLPDYNGETVRLSDFKGKNIVLWFFPKANTPGWAIEGQGFREEFSDFQKLGYEIIGVSGDSLKKQKKFVEKYNFPFIPSRISTTLLLGSVVLERLSDDKAKLSGRILE